MAASVGAVAGLGATRTSIPARRVQAEGTDIVAEACRRSGVRVDALSGALGSVSISDGRPDRQQIYADIDTAKALGAQCLYGLTGRAGDPIGWPTSAAAFAKSVAPAVEYAARLGLRLAVEPTNLLYADLTFVHTFRDAVELASDAGLGVCLDIFHVWPERHLLDDIAAHVDVITHVQLGDLVLGDRCFPSRAVPGRGDIPLDAIVRCLVAAGYSGVFDLELNGPRIDGFGHLMAAAEAARWLSSLLVSLDA